MSLDLEGIRELVEEEFMDENVLIERDAVLINDETWDAETLTYSGGDPPEEIYNNKGWVSTETPAAEAREGGAKTLGMWYWLNIPLDAPPVQDGDLVTVTASLRDPQLPNATFIIQHDEVGTFKVKRRIRMRRVIVTRTS